ncbi:MAG TPA: hypothetical protein VFG68_17335 [Fimbriiglobus sp.]|nr:hypothetical protein [Fimbriiglobus sp.]
MRSLLLSAAVVAVLLVAAPGRADAHGPPRFGRNFGNGPHDTVPHWHKTLTPFGQTYWYGNGLHDVLPHSHRVSPWGGVQGYSFTPFGPTKSYNGFPHSSGYFGGYGYPSFGGGYFGYSSPWRGW